MANTKLPIELIENFDSLIGVAKNLIINGTFDYWQRGFGFTPTGGDYTGDRWRYDVDLGAGGTIDDNIASRQTFTFGQTDVPSNPKYHMRVSGQVAGSGDNTEYVALTQAIEDVALVSGQEVTVSFYAKAASARDIGLTMRQHFGTSGTPSADVFIEGTNVSLTTDWQRFEQTFTIPSVSGKSLGTDKNDYLAMMFVLHGGSASDVSTVTGDAVLVDIANVQVERGNRATNMEIRPKAVELLMCQRYFEKSFDVDVTPISDPPVSDGVAFGNFFMVNANTTADGGRAIFAATKRVIPTIQPYRGDQGPGASPTGNNWKFQRSGTLGYPATGVTPWKVGQRSFAIFLTFTGQTIPLNEVGSVYGHWTADAEL